MTAWPFGALEPRRYRVILADPATAFKRFTTAKNSRGPESHYTIMTKAELMALPVRALAHPEGAMLVAWTTFPYLANTFDLLKAWGARYSTGGAWGKLTAAGEPAMGTGYVLRGAAELYLVARIGAGVAKHKTKAANSVRNLILDRRRDYSRKPDQLHSDIETLWRGPYCELFARSRRRGWKSWGNEVDKFSNGECGESHGPSQ